MCIAFLTSLSYWSTDAARLQVEGSRCHSALLGILNRVLRRPVVLSYIKLALMKYPVRYCSVEYFSQDLMTRDMTYNLKS